MAEQRVVITGAFPERAEAELRSRGFALTRLPGDADEERLVGELAGAWALVHGGTALLSRRVWEQAPSLAVVCVLATGYRSFIELPAEPGAARFTYTPHANAVAVAEFALAQLLDLVRGVSRGAAGVSRGEWIEQPTQSLTDARLGIVGMGHIGRELARMAQAAFGTRIRYWNRTDRPELAALPYERSASLIELFESCDMVSLHVDLVPGQTEGMIGAEHLRALDGGFLVNTSRATLVDPAALRAALREGRLAGAAIDGYYAEPAPDPQNDPFGLLEFVPDRLLVTGHNAYHTHQALQAMADMAVANLLAVADGALPPYPVPGEAVEG
ncbi:D-isomer specific 2-hydroxyacid dehydrogenase family protein [Kitasatospora sp. MAP5-34]|uniref:2-hydroxyacid dehydrogenase n=1 Tax=Kitasatospora sp. MAP5-34 TaxID=3035102 RepID=UPI00247607F6|nr:D-isomer specific 2-hydroxyacid dehydrogenase family protein [Kitasatospora sp. MAP5-34]MDH6578162.1 phosphoglycerate dehydrogenase-like enzyme [Kitasatospora sp. MAP5-34]